MTGAERRTLHVRKNDTVVVLAGKDKGRTGRVLRVLPAEGRVIVERVNFMKKHTKANPQRNIKGGILEREAPVDASNLMVVCSECSSRRASGTRSWTTAKRSGPAAAAAGSWTNRGGRMAQQQAAGSAAPQGRYVPRLKTAYRSEVVRQMMERHGYRNPMAVPRLHKVVVNMGVGEASKDIKVLDAAIDQLGVITGQRPVTRRARKSIANFKIREGMPIGCTVTLRGNRMYDFFDRLVSVTLPRVRDFRGLSTRSFDGRGNYTMGLKDQLVFLEINYAKVDKVHGMNVTIVTTANTDEEAKNLLQLLGLPFRKD